MALSNKDYQRKFKDKMYAAGYKQMIVWVPRDSGKENKKIEQKIFIRRLTALTVGMSKTKLTRLYRDILVMVKDKKEEKET